jgi:hypothetical protein
VAVVVALTAAVVVVVAAAVVAAREDAEEEGPAMNESASREHVHRGDVRRTQEKCNTA